MRQEGADVAEIDEMPKCTEDERNGAVKVVELISLMSTLIDCKREEDEVVIMPMISLLALTHTQWPMANAALICHSE